jgi:hypothetical protein
MLLVSTFHDPKAIFLSLLKKAKKALIKNFRGAIIACTASTHPQSLVLLKEAKLTPITAGLWGEARRKALCRALKSKGESFLVCDFDKILHWLEAARNELGSILDSKPTKDCLIFGRSQKVMATYPDSWVKTEQIINHLVGKIIGQKVDILAATWILSRRAARIICQEGRQKSWGACSEWPLLIHQAGLKLGYQEARGLTWEDPDRFQKEIKEAGGLKAWQSKKYDSFKEWNKRLSSLTEQFSVIKNLL